MNPRTGTVFKRNGLWGVRVSYTDPASGKRRYLKRTCLRAHLTNTKTAADGDLKQQLLREVEILLGSGDYRPETSHALLLHFERTYARPAEYHDGKRVAGYCSVATVRANLKTLRRVLPNKQLRTITYDDLTALKMTLVRDPIVRVKKVKGNNVRTERPRSTANINRILAHLRTVFLLAEANGWMRRSPFPKKGEHRKAIIETRNETPRTRIVSDAEETRLLAACIFERAHLRPIYIALVDTGVRWGELIRLERRHIDFDAGEISVYATKTEEPRTVPLSDRLRAELLAWGDDQLPDDARPFGLTTIKTAWRSLLKASGVAGVRIHDLRHTAATRMIEGGMELAEVARILGHRDIRTTYRYVNAHAGTVEKARTIFNQRAIASDTLPVN